MNLYQEYFENRKRINNDQVIIDAAITSMDEDIHVALRFFSPFFKMRGERFTAPAVKHFITDDIIRLAESLQILFRRANIPLSDLLPIRLLYLQSEDSFSTLFDGFMENETAFTDQHCDNFDFLMEIFHHQCEVSLRYMKGYWDEAH